MKRNRCELPGGMPQFNHNPPLIPFTPSFKLQCPIPNFSLSQAKLPGAVKFEKQLDKMKAQRESAMATLKVKSLPKFTESRIPNPVPALENASLPTLEKMEKQLAELRARNKALTELPRFSESPIRPDLESKLRKEAQSLRSKIVLVPDEARLPRDWHPLPNLLIEDVTTVVALTKKEQDKKNVKPPSKVNILEEESFSTGGTIELIKRRTPSDKVDYGLTLYDFARGGYATALSQAALNAQVTAEINYGINLLSAQLGTKYYRARVDLNGPNGYLQGRMHINVDKNGVNFILDTGGGVFAANGIAVLKTEPICFQDSCVQANINTNVGVGFGGLVGVGFQNQQQKSQSSLYFTAGLFLGIGKSFKVAIDITPNKKTKSLQKPK
jgi:hypothetical protein